MTPNLMRSEQVRETIRSVAHCFYERAFEFADVVVYDKVHSEGVVTWPSVDAKEKLIEQMTDTFVAFEWRGANNNRGYGRNSQKLMSFGEEDKRYVVYGLDLSASEETYREQVEDTLGHLVSYYNFDTDAVVSHINDLRGIAFENVMFSDCDFSRTRFEDCSLENVDVMFSDVMEDASLSSRAPLSFDRCITHTSLVAVQGDIADDYREAHELYGGELGVVDGNGNASVLHIKDVFKQSDINNAARKAASDYSFTNMDFEGSEEIEDDIVIQCDSHRPCYLDNVTTYHINLKVYDAMSVDVSDSHGTFSFFDCYTVSLKDSSGDIYVTDSDLVSFDSCRMYCALFSYVYKVSMNNCDMVDVCINSDKPMWSIDVQSSRVTTIDARRNHDGNFLVTDIHIADSRVRKCNVKSDVLVVRTLDLSDVSFFDMSGKVVLGDIASANLSNVVTDGTRMSWNLCDPWPYSKFETHVKADQVSDDLLLDLYHLGDASPDRVTTEFSGTNLNVLPPQFEPQGIDLSALFDELDNELGTED